MVLWLRIEMIRISARDESHGLRDETPNAIPSFLDGLSEFTELPLRPPFLQSFCGCKMEQDVGSPWVPELVGCRYLGGATRNCSR